MFNLIFRGEGNSRIFEDNLRGITVQTPLYVPSISGWKVKNLSWMAQNLREIALPQRIFMLSAFDARTLDEQTLDMFEDYSERNLVYLDSGGYESYHKHAPWDFSNYIEGVSKIRFDILTVFDRIPWADETQIITEMKEELHATNKLVKGGRKTLILHTTRTTQLSDLESLIKEEKDEFDILGVPESLCDSEGEGIKTVRALRTFMDQTGIIKPIHIFGCGKMSYILQLVEAGADIFDANSWIYNVYNPIQPFSKNISHEELSSCICESCRSKRSWSSTSKRRYSHNFLAITKGMNMIKQSIIDNRLINLMNCLKL